ncbi:unnamed protein product [Effrenium voratum]|nr:unnamed protein product [Effrenium voratum]
MALTAKNAPHIQVKAAPVSREVSTPTPRPPVPRPGVVTCAVSAAGLAIARTGRRRQRGRSAAHAKGFGTEWDTAKEQTQVDAEATSTSLAEQSQSSSALSELSDGRERVFDPSVLRGPKGEILSDGEAPRPEGAEEFFSWLRDRGSSGLDHVQLLLGGGVAMRRKARAMDSGQELLAVPRDAWITPEVEADQSSLEALAWRLLRERSLGEDSSFAPFVQHLCRQDLSAHPIFWEDDEVDWVRPSPEAFELVCNLQAQTKERQARLLARAAAEVSMATRVEEDLEALTAEVRWALAVVETRSIEAQDGSGGAMVALCPLIGDFRPVSAGPELASFETEGDRLVLSAQKRLQPGEEVLQKVQQSSAWHLVKLGVVPGSEKPGVPSDAELVECNEAGNCWLPGPETDPSSYPKQTFMGTKIELLLEHAKLDFRGPRLPWMPPRQYCFVLPDEAFGSGRLLPAARFIIADIAGMGSNIKTWMRRWFVRFFRHCKLESLPSTKIENASEGEEVDKVLTMVHDTKVEVMARRIVGTWAQQAILKKDEMIEQIASSTGLPLGENGVIVVKEGQTVKAYFKAKRKDGTVGKSKKPREAVVISIEEQTLRVKFANKKRHEIPHNWVVSSTPLPNPKLLTAGCSPERLARGKLAITLLRSEKSILGLVMETLSEAADMLEELSNGVEGCKERGDPQGAEKLMKVIRHYLDQELVDLDEELSSSPLLGYGQSFREYR